MRYFVVLFLSLLFVTTPAQAANLPLFNPDFTIVPEACHSCPCSFAGTLQLVQNVMNVMISFGVLIIILVIVMAGFQFLMSAANPHGKEQAKGTFVKAIIGFLVVISAWLVVDFIMKTLYDPEVYGDDGNRWGPWNEIITATDPSMCIEETGGAPILDAGAIGGIVGGTNPGSTGTGNMSGVDGCPDCVPLSDYGVACQARGCNADPRLAERLRALDQSYSGNWTVTEGYPKSRSHRNVCHDQGTCVDADFIGGGYTEANFRAFGTAADAAGIRAVFESSDCDEVAVARRAGVEAACYGRDVISGSHFSLYGRR